MTLRAWIVYAHGFKQSPKKETRGAPMSTVVQSHKQLMANDASHLSKRCHIRLHFNMAVPFLSILCGQRFLHLSPLPRSVGYLTLRAPWRSMATVSPIKSVCCTFIHAKKNLEHLHLKPDKMWSWCGSSFVLQKQPESRGAGLDQTCGEEIFFNLLPLVLILCLKTLLWSCRGY